jgi:hypothetical protein
MNVYEAAIAQPKKMLENLDRWLEAGVAFAKKKSFDPNVLLSARLAPDQYPLVRQVQSACDSAKLGASRLLAKEAPKHPDTEQTMDEARARIRTCTDYLSSLTPNDFAGADERWIALPFLENKVIRGDHYLLEWAQPNLYFHVTTAYAILRHNGVDLGKRDFVGSLTLKDK